MIWASEDSLKKFRKHFGIKKLTDTAFEQLNYIRGQ